MKCEDCSHAEMCKWIDELEGRGCDFGEPCEDAISREAVIEWLKDKDIIKLKSQEENARKELMSLPSVTQKSGHWIERDKRVHYAYWERYKCSKCGHYGDNDYKFCPNCGAKMVEPQESEDKK